ncbi:MAG: hypothetical protein KDD44_06775, partial [Bdellovibrionales bacterium]|nr:hypothetical protein [Bdellovibrionales bacterium]
VARGATTIRARDRMIVICKPEDLKSLREEFDVLTRA